LGSSARIYGKKEFYVVIEHLTLIITSRNESRENQVLLIDEPDQYLHPSKIKHLIDLLKKYFVQELKIQVIMTKKNPSTISLMDDQDIFVMYQEKDKIKIVNNEKSPIDAIQLLSTGVWKNLIQQLVLVCGVGCMWELIPLFQLYILINDTS